MIITCPRLSCLTLPIVVSFVTCLFIALLDVFCLRVIHSCIFVSCISQRLGFSKRIDCLVYFLFFFFFLAGKDWELVGIGYIY